jgi:DNA topoisomerase-2
MQHTEQSVSFDVHLKPQKSEWVEKLGLEAKLHLHSTISLDNMHLFDRDGRLRHYRTPLEIIEEFYPVRLEHYTRRRQLLLQQHRSDATTLDARSRFCESVASGELPLRSMSKQALVEELQRRSFAMVDGSFDYLLNTPIYSLTMERMQRLQKDRDELLQQAQQMERARDTDLWKQELEMFMKEYKKMK